MKIRRSNAATSDIDMTPMIDMTFQLITFFMFVLNFSKDTVDERVRLPIADQARPVEAQPEEPLFLNIDRDGYLLAIGQRWNVEKEIVAIEGYLRREASYTKLSMQAAAAADPNGKAAKDLRGNRLWTTIIVRADRATPYRAIRELIGVSQKIGYYQFAMRAMEREQ
jgi:biopolymer transport protein ExbD